MNLEPSISFVPTIIYNDVFNADDQWRSLTDFAAVVCDKINGNKPQFCESKQLPTTSGWWPFWAGSENRKKILVIQKRFTIILCIVKLYIVCKNFENIVN